MNKTIELIVSHVPSASSVHTNRSMSTVYLSAAAVMTFIVIQLSLSWIYANAKLIWLFIVTFVNTPLKFTTFLTLGQAPLRYFGYLDDFPLLNVVEIACIGGLAMSIPHFIYDMRNPKAESIPLTEEEEFNKRKRRFQLDRALQAKVTILLVREINQAIIVVLVGVSVMRLTHYRIDSTDFDLLLTTALFGPTIFFVLFISSAGSLLGVSWFLQKFRDWWHGWSWL